MRTMKHWALAVMAAAALALAGCGGGGSAAGPSGPTLEDRQTTQRAAISSAIMNARTAVAAVMDDSDDAVVTAADTAIAAARTAISGAADVPAAEKAANTGTVAALETQLTDAKSSRKMAMDDAAEQQRLATIAAAEGVLSGAKMALEALDDDATDQEKLGAQRMVEAAANALRDVLQMNGGSDADIEDAIRMAQTAKVAADELQAMVTAAANAAEAARMAAIGEAQMTLSDAEDARDMLADDATDKEKRAAHRAVQMAANELIQVLEDNDGTADQIMAATMARDSAMSMADALTSPIDIADQRQAITDALATLSTAVAAVDDDATDAQVQAADDAVAAARQAIMDATELPEAETTAHGALVTAHAEILAAAKTSRMAVLDAEAAKVAEAAKAASNKIALTKKAAIEVELEGADTVAVRPFDGDTPYDTAESADNTATNYRVQVEHDGGPKVTVTDGHGDYDAKNDPKFEKAAMFGNGQMLVRNDGTAREIIVLHTDIEAPKDVRFGRTGSGYALTVDVDTDTSSLDSYLVNIDADGSKLGGSRIVSPDPGTKTLAQWEATGDNADNVFPGTLDGAAGTFRCQDSGGCTITTTAGATADDDNVVAVTGVLWFTPDAGATVEIADSDYLTWGFWLDTTTKDGEITSYDVVQTFATSSLPVDARGTALDTITGSATYEGDAAGVYVHETKKEDGSRDIATSGRFTADVALNAYFDAMGAFAANRIQGTISNFDLDGGPDNSWNVDVNAHIVSDSNENIVLGGQLDPTLVSTNTVTERNADGGGAAGSISGTFHSSAATAGDATAAPDALVGEFSANFVNGTAAGAFGARKQ